MRSLPWRRHARNTTPARLTATVLLGSAVTVAALVATDVLPAPSWADLDGIDVASHQHPVGAAVAEIRERLEEGVFVARALKVHVAQYAERHVRRAARAAREGSRACRRGRIGDERHFFDTSIIPYPRA